MQINRLFEIVYILLEKEKVPAKKLAERFEVSTRTIYRDVETLSSCGIPIYMSKGKNGGISLLPDFVLNKAVLTEQEKNNILSALDSLNIFKDASVENTMSKIGLFFGQNNTNFFQIDYSDWSNRIKDSFEKAKRAILERRLLSFNYISAMNQSSPRLVEPYMLWFKEKTWYLRAFCLDRNEMRTFRFSRMKNMQIAKENFVPRAAALHQEVIDSAKTTPETKIVLRVEANMEYRVMDEFPEADIIQNEDGSFTVTIQAIEDEWVYGYLLSFGNFATVLEPLHIRELIKKRLEETIKNYL